MRLPAPLWLKVVLLATAAVFVGELAYLYGFKFSAWLDSDASVPVLLADKALDAKFPVVASWYYANGDVWVLAPHLFAIVPVAVLGVGPPSLLLSLVLGFGVEVVLYARLYARLCGESWVGVFAAMVTMMAWSNGHVAFVYMQLAYGFGTLLFVLTFSSYATLAAEEPIKRWRWVATGFLVALLVVANPTRGLVFVLLPLLAGCLWPWKGLARRSRLAIAISAIAGWTVGFLVYRELLQHTVAWSIPRGHLDFVIKDVHGILANLRMLGKGLLLLCGGGESSAVRMIPGVLVMAGALAWVGRELFTSRSFTAMRFLCVVVAAQLGGLLLPLLIGNLLIAPSSVRYTMPSLLAVFGLAAMLAVRSLAETAVRWVRAGAIAWLVLVPIAAVLAVPDIHPPKPAAYGWPDAEELEVVGDALAKRGLTHGFANMLNANLLNLESRGRSKTCSVYFAHVLIPQRWLVDTQCYTASVLPEKFYVVADHHERDDTALRATFPAPVEKFSVGDTYVISVYRKADVPLVWLELPLIDGDETRFPLRIAADHLALRRGVVALANGRMVATGEEGYVTFGPYMELPKGQYVLRWSGSALGTEGVITFSVASDVGKSTVKTVTVDAKDLPASGALIRIPFVLHRTGANVEFTVFSAGGARVALDEMTLERL